ncbi:uncharacterized protein [Rutidosis leptorrhynchoides]|uniref:uncharacterized protein n=1 Tax=Rutidosis leptorrhynchoides TaxID=125765 RepID=UPI003A98FF35
MVDHRNMTMGERMRVERRKLIELYLSPSVTNEGYQKKEEDEVVVNIKNMSMKERMIAEGFCPCFYGSWQCCMNPNVKHSSPLPTMQHATDHYSPLILFPENSNVTESSLAPQLVTSQSILQDELVVEKCTRLDPLSELLQDFPELHSYSSSYIDEIVLKEENGLLLVLMANGYEPTTEELKEVKLEIEPRSIVEIHSGSMLIPEDVKLGNTIFKDPFDQDPPIRIKVLLKTALGGESCVNPRVRSSFFGKLKKDLSHIIYTTRGVNDWLTILIRGTFSTDFTSRPIKCGGL